MMLPFFADTADAIYLLMPIYSAAMMIAIRYAAAIDVYYAAMLPCR